MILRLKKHSAIACLLLASAAAGLCAPPSQPVKPPQPKKGFDAYPLVRTRNIFDPERQPGVASPGSGQSQATQPQANTDFAALTGVLVTPEKTLAFFSGSRPEFNKVLPLNATIAGATLTKITPDSIEVEREGKSVTVAVGQTVPLNNSFLPTTAPIPSSDATPGDSPVPQPRTDREALIRRMMEKRQQELK